MTQRTYHAACPIGVAERSNGARVPAFDAPLPQDVAAEAAELGALRAGKRVLADGRAWDVASVVQARLLAAQGELPAPPRLDGELHVVDLRNSDLTWQESSGSKPRCSSARCCTR